MLKKLNVVDCVFNQSQTWTGHEVSRSTFADEVHLLFAGFEAVCAEWCKLLHVFASMLDCKVCRSCLMNYESIKVWKLSPESSTNEILVYVFLAFFYFEIEMQAGVLGWFIYLRRSSSIMYYRDNCIFFRATVLNRNGGGDEEFIQLILWKISSLTHCSYPYQLLVWSLISSIFTFIVNYLLTYQLTNTLKHSWSFRPIT